MTLQTIDKNVFLWCNRFQQNPRTLTSFRLISRSGDGYMYIALGLLALLIDSTHGALFAALMCIGFAFEIPSFITLKKLIRRDRPFVAIDGARKAVDPSDKFSLPSGHTTAAFLMAGLILYCYPQWGLLAFSWASLIGFSRVILGVHYPTDILAGAVLGSSCALLAINLGG